MKLMQFDDCSDYSNFNYDNIQSEPMGFQELIPTYGNVSPEYQYIAENYKTLEYDLSLVRKLWLDIEVVSYDGFPDPKICRWPITSITIKDSRTNKFYVMSLKKYDPRKTILDIDPKMIQFKYHKTEEELLETCIDVWKGIEADVTLGWHAEGFDYPYLFNRMRKLLPKNSIKDLSPLKVIDWRKKKGHDPDDMFRIKGQSNLDLMKMYKKYIFKPRESYALDFIAEAELGENKIDYSEYDNLNELWEKNPQKYIDYNIYDVELMDRIDKKLGLVDLHCAIAYKARSNFVDVMGTVTTWDNIFYNDLKSEGILCPPRMHNHSEPYAGAYVKHPILKKHKWVISVDLNSLYPHLHQQYNISPECLVDSMEAPNEDVSQTHIDNLILHQKIKPNPDYVLAGNGWYFRKDKEGFIPKILRGLYTERANVKKEMLKEKQILVKLKEKLKKEGHSEKEIKNHTAVQKQEKVVSTLNNQQMAAKVLMNSEYGALANRWFRYYDIRLASAVTLSGQLAIRWIEEYIMRHPLQKKYKWQFLYSDTDSGYISIEYLVNMILEKHPDMPTPKLLDKIDEFTDKVIQPILDAGYEKLAKYVNANENRMFMKRELVISEVIWTAKKKYAMNVWDDEGVRYETPKMKVKGIEVVRSSTPKIIRDKLKEAIKIILSKDMLDVIEFAKEVQDDFNGRDVEEIAFPRGVSKVTKYKHPSFPAELCIKGTPIAVRGALVYNRYIEKNSLLKQFQEIRNGDKTKFVYMKPNNPGGENVFGFLKRMPNKDVLKKFVDYELQFYKTFMKVLENIYEKIDEPRPFRLDYASEMNSKSFFQKMRERKDE